MAAERNIQLTEATDRSALLEVQLEDVHWTRTFPSMLEAALNAERLSLVERGMSHVIATTACFSGTYRCRVPDRYDPRQLRAAGFSATMLLQPA